MNLAKSHHVDVVIYNNPEKHLVTLRKQQKEKVEEIKKKTNYDSTRNLIERYDDSADSPLRRRANGASTPVTPQKAPTPQPPKTITPQPRGPVQIPPSLQQQLSREFFFPKLGEVVLIGIFSITPTSYASTTQALV